MSDTENERDRLRSALQAAELRIAAALAECAPTQADRYDYSAKEHSELAARVRALRERAEGAEIEGKARMSGMRKKLQVAERERDEAREANCRYGERYGLAIGARDKALDERNEALAELEKKRTFFAASCADSVEYLAERDAARAEASELRAEVERLRGALEFYAAPESWVEQLKSNYDMSVVELEGWPTWCSGKRAREALGK